MTYGGGTYGGVAYAEEAVDVRLELTAPLVTFDAAAPTYATGTNSPPAADSTWSMPVPSLVVEASVTAPAFTASAPTPGLTLAVSPTAPAVTFNANPPATRLAAPAGSFIASSPAPGIRIEVAPDSALVTFSGYALAGAVRAPVSDLPTALIMEELGIDLELAPEAECVIEEKSPAMTLSVTGSQLGLVEPATLELDPGETELILDGP